MIMLDRFLTWAREHKTAFLSLAVFSHIAVAAYMLFSLNWFLAKNSEAPPMSIVAGAERLYPVVRKGDDEFERGAFEQAWNYYSDAKDALRELQETYPERGRLYREAERVVQSRMYLAEVGGRLSDLDKSQ